MPLGIPEPAFGTLLPCRLINLETAGSFASVYTVVVHPSRALLHATLKGFFTVKEVRDFASELQNAVIGMGCSSGDWLHMCDITQLQLQSQQVAEVFTNIVNNSAHRSRRLAIVAGRTAVRMQIKRILTRSDAAIFETPQECEAWLFGSVEA